MTESATYPQEWRDPRRRARFRELADVLIPAEGPMPSASAADAGGRGLDLVLRARRDLDEPLRAAVSYEESRPAAEAVAALEAVGGAVWQALTVAVAAAYYSDPGVRKLIGYHGQQARKVDPFEYIRYVEDGLLDDVIARGPCFQVPPSRE